MLILGLPIACWGLFTVGIFVCAAAVSNRLSILQFGACMITIWLLGLGVIAWDPYNDIPDEIPGVNATQTLNPGYGWSCQPVNNSTVPGERDRLPARDAGGRIMNTIAAGFLMLTLLGFLCFGMWACISLSGDYSYGAGIRGMQIFGLVMAVGIIGATGAALFIPSEEPAAPDLRNATITQNGTLHCTFLNASDPESGYVCLPATTRGAGP